MRKQMRINKELLPMKGLYFLQLSIIASLMIYTNPFMSEWGITSTEIAVMNFVANIFAIFSRPFFGYIADKYQIYKHLIIFLAISSAVIFSLHLASPKYLKRSYSLNGQYNLNVSSDKTILITDTSPQFLNICWPYNLSQCRFNDRSSWDIDLMLEQTRGKVAYYTSVSKGFSDFSSESLFCDTISEYCNETQQKVFKSDQHNQGLTYSAAFWFLALIKTLSFISFSPLISLTDAVTFVALGSLNAHRFGFTRMFGTIGVLAMSLIMAGILKVVSLFNSATGSSWLFKMQTFSQFTPCFIVSVVILLLVVVVASFLRTEQPIKTEHLLGSLKILYRDFHTSIFFIFAVLGGFVLQIFGEYFYLILYQRYSSLPKYFPGLVTVVMTASESVFFGISSYLLQYKGYEIWISLSFLAWSFRWFSYIFMDNFWFLLLTEALHGPSFGLMLASMISHVSTLGTSATQGRLQGLFSAIFFNIGGALGGLVGGIILDNFKMFGLFKFMTALSLICTLYYPIQVCLIRRMCNHVRQTSEIVQRDSDNGERLLPKEAQV